MKTVMQEFLKELKEHGFYPCESKFTYLIEKEKQQIIDSNNAGYKAHRKKLDQNAEDYYNETFKKD